MNLARKLLAGTAVVVSLTAFAALATCLSYVKMVAKDLPSLQALVDWKPSSGTTITADDGTVFGVHAAEFRKFVPFERIPKVVVDAFVAAEDGQFWTHRGVNPVAIARAAISKLKDGGRLGGASTIDQQVVKNVVLTAERSIDRKIKEALLALKADKEIGKRRIAEIYLNEIYLGQGSYGVAAAAETYFGKTLDRLSLAEAATLATMPKAPSVVNPVRNMQRTLERRSYVLGRMLEDGYIAQAQHDAADAEPIVLASRKAAAETTKTEPAFRSPEEAARRELMGALGKDKFLKDGGTVKTTISADLQRVVHRELRIGLVHEDRRSGWKGPLARRVAFPVDWTDPALAPPAGAEDWIVGVVASGDRDAEIETKEGLVTVSGESLSWASGRKRASALLRRGDAVLIGDLGKGLEVVSIPEVQGAVVALDPVTGEVKALDGGFSAEQSEFNRATQAKRQTGSAFKPFVYLAALELGYDAMSPILDAPIAIEQGPGLADWRPTSHDAGMGLITLRRSLELSRNESTVRLLYDLGLDRVADVAGKVGFRLPAKLTWSMALGTAETSPLNVAEAYAAVANGGHRVKASLFAETAARDAEPSFDPVAVAQLSSVLEGVSYAGTAKGAFEGFDKPMSSKTGTTDKSKDTWFAAYGPKFVLVTWVGRDDNKPLPKGAAGGTTAAGIARRIFDGAAQDFLFEDFELPDGADTVLADRATGLPDQDGDVVEIVRKEDEQVEVGEINSENGGEIPRMAPEIAIPDTEP